MKALVLSEPGKLVMEERPIREPGENEVLVKTKAATICTSDINDIKYNAFGIHMPMIMGHEGAGIVVATGNKVRGILPGDSVAAHPVMPCGTCVSCRQGLPHLCECMEHLGINREGVFAEYFCIRSDRVRKIPDGMGYEEASLMEPVSVCLEGIRRAKVKEGASCLIIGDGPFGIITARLLKKCNPGSVILVGRHGFRMEKAPDVLKIHEKITQDVRSQVMELTKGQGIDSAILCVGTEAAVNLGISCLRARGTLSVFSAVPNMPRIDLFRVHVKELNISGSCNDENFLDEALEAIGDKKLGLGQMITHRIPFQDWEKAFWLAEYGKDEALKVTLTFDHKEAVL